MRPVPSLLGPRLRRCTVLLLAGCTGGDSSSVDRPPPVDSARPADSAPPADSGRGVVGCSADARPGLAVTAIDARSGAVLGDFTVVLEPERTAADRRRDSSRAGAAPTAVWYGALEQAGRFTLRVTKEGYRPWDSTGVEVTRDVCHVRTVRLAVPLEPR